MKNKYIKKYIKLFIIIVIIILYYNIAIYSSSHIESFSTSSFKYYKCSNKQLSPIMSSLFNQLNITKGDINDWQLYLPCGYNNIESDLLQIKLPSSTQHLYIFGINGCDNMVSKNGIWLALCNKYGRIKASTIMPETYILNDATQMDLFKQNYSSDNIYILKKNIQRKEGLKLTSDYNEIVSENKGEFKVVQKYIRNIYLVNGKKVNLRIYLLVIISNGVVKCYISKDGKCIYTNKNYDDSNLNFENNITSYQLDINIYKTHPYDLTELYEHINKNGNDSSILINNINTILSEMCTCLSFYFYQSNNLISSSVQTTSFQLFGLDVIFTKDLVPYLLEVNKGPDMKPRNDKDKQLKTKVQLDMLNLVLNTDTNANINNNGFYILT